MSPKKTRPKEPSHSNGRARRRPPSGSLSALLALALCAPAAFAHASRADDGRDAPRLAQSQNPAQPEPSPTPHVRRRTVSPKPEPERPAASPQTPQPAPVAAGPQATPQTSTQPQPAATPAPQPPAQSSDAAGQESEEVDENEVVRVESNLVIIPASVVDSRGRAITDLKVEDFELKVDGEVKTIGDLSRAETPVNVALLFDNSASLSAAREFEKQAAVRFFQSVVRPIDRAAVYSISTMPTLAQQLTNDVPRLVRTIERFGKPEGATALFDALTQAADYMRPVAGRKVIVLVSDGTDTVSDASFDDAVNRALRAECQVYVVQTRQVEDPNLHDPVSEQRMYRISEQTGGAVFIPRSVEELDAVFTQISLDLSQQYLLSYYPQDERKDKYFRFISVRVKSRPTLRVRARKGFYPPSAAQAGAQATGDRAQFSGGLAGGTAPEYVAANQTSQPNNDAVALRRANGSTPPAAPRAAAGSARARPGPDGPDNEDVVKTASDASQPTPTFTITTTSSPAAPKPTPAPSSANVETTPASVAEAPRPTALLPAFTPAPSRPVPSIPFTIDTSPSRRETRTEAEAPEEKATTAEKAPAVEKASAVPQPAEAAAPGDAERPKAPLSGGVLNGKALNLPKPVYPSAAKNSGAAGKVVVEVTIDERGKVVEARAVSGHPFLQQAAVQAARQARFSPATLSGLPVKVKGTINYVFSLP